MQGEEGMYRFVVETSRHLTIGGHKPQAQLYHTWPDIVPCVAHAFAAVISLVIIHTCTCSWGLGGRGEGMVRSSK